MDYVRLCSESGRIADVPALALGPTPVFGGRGPETDGLRRDRLYFSAGRFQMRRREFISLFGGVAAVWPLAGHAQQAGRMKRIGALMSIPIDDPQSVPRATAFAQGLQALGWTVGRNVKID